MSKKKGKDAGAPPVEEEQEVVKDEVIGDLKDGEFLFQDGAVYTGSYLKIKDEVLMHGEGILQSGPEVFQGIFERGQYKEGTFKSCNGAIYVGAFLENKFHGLGEYTWNAKMPDERSYVGMWKNGYMHGHGEFMNFSFGVHKNFRGFAFQGRFSSAREEQEQLKSAFLAEYGGEISKSATSAMKDMAEKAAPDLPAAYLVPKAATEEGADEKPEAAAERAAIEELVTGPFPSGAAPALQAFAARLAEDADKPLQIKVLEDKDQSRFVTGRLRHEQLQYVGQAVEFEAPDAEVGAIRAVILLNIANAYDIAATKWKLVHIEEVPAPS